MKQLFSSACLFLAAMSTSFAQTIPNYKDAQLCTNAYNRLWNLYDTVKSEHRQDSAAQIAIFSTEFPKILTPDFKITFTNLPTAPNSDQVYPPIIAQGIPEVVQVAAVQLPSWGQHHVASPFSFKTLSSSTTYKTRVYQMTTRDIDFGNLEGNQGCATFLAQKSTTCIVKNTGGPFSTRKAMLSNINANVVTTFVMPLPNCTLWIAAPVEDFPTES